MLVLARTLQAAGLIGLLAGCNVVGSPRGSDVRPIERVDSGPARPAADILVTYLDAGAPGACASNPGEDFAREDDRALLALGRLYDVATGNWAGGWWTSANAVEAVENSYDRTQGESMRYLVEETFDRNSGAGFLNAYYDDEGWWANAWVRAYDATGDVAYLQMAESLFQDIAGGWDDTCGGGVWWSKSRTYKNAIPNELFLLLAASLHNRAAASGAATDGYLAWAQREWAWFQSSGMISPAGLVNDGLTSGCRNNGGQTWTYNQGVLLGALSELYLATGDGSLLTQGEQIATAAITHLVTDGGILREPCEPACSGDAVQFKGAFTRNLAKLYALDRNPAYGEFLVLNARSIWERARNGADELGLVWSGPFDSADYVRQDSAMVTLSSAAPDRTQTAPFAEAAGSPLFCHAAGRAAGAAWACDPRSCPAPGFMLNGPYLASLAPGQHTAHFRLEVSQTSALPVELAVADVYSPTTQTVLAQSPVVLWSDFAGAYVGHDVALTFTAAPDVPVEFRVFWGAPAAGPTLVVDDVLVDADGAAAGALEHDLGRPDGHGRWEADSARDVSPGALLRGPVRGDLPAQATFRFELKAEPPGGDQRTVARLTVSDAEDGTVVGGTDVTWSQFPTSRYQELDVPFLPLPGHRYLPTVSWLGASSPLRLTARGVYIAATPSDLLLVPPYDLRAIGTRPGDANADGVGYGLDADEVGSSVLWRGHWFALGPTGPGQYNALAGGPAATVPVPNQAGSVLHLLLLATNGAQWGQEFRVIYADQTEATFTRDLPDWFASAPSASADFALGMAKRWSSTGPSYGNMHLLHAALPVDPGRPLGTLVLPDNPHVKLLAVTLSRTD